MFLALGTREVCGFAREFLSDEQAHVCGGPRGAGQGNCELEFWKGKIKVSEGLEWRWWCGMDRESLLAVKGEIGMCFLIENSEGHKSLKTGQYRVPHCFKRRIQAPRYCF